MTGYLKYYKKEGGALDHVRVLFSFKNGYHLAYVSQRMLGSVSLAPSAEDFIEKQGFGPDAFEIGRETFRSVVKKSRGALKSTLMNQNIIAGLGNIYADEVLFQSKIHPKKPANKLKDDSIDRLFRNMKKVLKKAVQWRADPQKFPATYLLPYRDEENDCPLCGAKIRTVKVSGRTAYFCPRCQAK
jgi:formamidopyrimidine-DNA glycosylase